MAEREIVRTSPSLTFWGPIEASSGAWFSTTASVTSMVANVESDAYPSETEKVTL